MRVFTARSYVFSVASVLLVAAIEEMIHAPIDDKSRLLVLLLPVAGSAWLGGVRPGLLALLLSCAAGAFLYLPPKYSILVNSPTDVFSLLLYFSVSLCLIGIIESLRKSKSSLAESEMTVKGLNRDLSRSLEKQEAALYRQKQFISDASHELKTPLTAIRARSEIALSNPPDTTELIDHMAAISRAAGIMTSVVQDLRLLAASDEGHLKLEKEPTKVESMVEDALASISHANHQIHVDIQYKSEVYCDPNAVTRVLVNILKNAIAYTPPNKVIDIKCVESTRMVNILIQDQGKGIPAEHLGLIFNRFHRVDSARDRESGGSGLGLAIAKAIVEAHDGLIILDSPGEQGTIVTIALPKQSASPEETQRP